MYIHIIYRVTVENVQMIPATFCGELLDVQSDARVSFRGLNQPGTLGIHSVIAHGIGQPALGTVEPEQQMSALIIRK